MLAQVFRTQYLTASGEEDRARSAIMEIDG
jgi:hypothetical protein